MTRTPDQESRVLLLAPTDRDRALTEAIFERAGVPCRSCTSLDGVLAELDVGGAALVLPEEVVAEQAERLTDWLERQPPWSDLPILVLTRPGADSAPVAQAMEMLRNITVLERPVRVAALISAVRSALRARARQYELRKQLVELQAAEAALRVDDQRKNEFLAVLAHELRNPLAPIRNAIQIIRTLCGKDSQLVDVSEMMDRQVKHLVRLVDDLMEVSRISRGKIDLRKEPVQLDAVLRTAIEASRPLIDGLGHHLAVVISGEPMPLDADATRLAQVFGNLLNNAAKYTDPGGTIWLTARRDGADVVVSVRDTGTGLAAEMLPRVFDMFVQADHTSARTQGGLGIGLTLARSLVELHGGTVIACSDGVGRGSEFVVRLPTARAGSANAATLLRGPSTARLSQARVLVVDDNRDAADSLRALLGMQQAEVLVAYSGPETFRVLEDFHPHVMVVDIGMPGMDGYAVARHIRQEPGLRDIVLIALTGWGQELDRKRTAAAGFDHHLTKPADIDALQALVAGALQADTPQRRIS